MEAKKISNYIKDAKWPIKKILKYTFLFLAIIVGLIILFAVMKVLFMYGLYSFFLGKISAMFGLDMTLARLIAIFTTVATLLALPSIISFLLFGKKKKEVFIMVLVVSVVWFLGLYYGTANVFFDRTTGKPAKCYIKTLEGFKFSSAEDFDPKFGIKFKPITPEVIKEYYFWQNTGKLESIPQVKAGKYFDMITGEPIVWCSERPNGEIKLFSLPGYDPMTGQLLKPITREISEVIEKKRAQEELERKRVEEENRKNKKREEKEAIEAAKAKAKAKEEFSLLRIRRIWGVAQSYSKDKVAGSPGGGYPEVKLVLVNDPIVWGHEIKWKGSYSFENGQLCLQIYNLEMPNSSAVNGLRDFGFSRDEYRDFGLGYYVQLDNAVFEDFTMAKFLFVFRTFLGDSPPSHIRKCFKVIPIKENEEKSYDISGEWTGKTSGGNSIIARIVQSGNKFTGVSIVTGSGGKEKDREKDRWEIDGQIFKQKISFVHTQKKTGVSFSFVAQVSSGGDELSGFWNSGLKYKGKWQMSRKGNFKGSPDDILEPEQE